MKRILIVEDDQLVATAYRRRLTDAGWVVEWAPDGIEGIKAVGIFRPDVVLLDLLMPRLDGIDVLKYIRNNPDHKHLPVVVFSNSYMTNLIENAFRSGADQCLMKATTTPQNLLDAINKAVQKAAARRVEMEWAVARSLGALPRPGIAAAEPRTRSSTAPSSALCTPVAQIQSPIPSPTASEPVGNQAPPVASPGGISPVVDPEFQLQIRQIFISGAGSKLQALRDGINTLTGLPVEDSLRKGEILMGLFRKVHSLSSNAAVAGCSPIAQFTSTVEAFLRDLEQKPRFINASTLRTLQRAVECLDLLFQHALEVQPPERERRVLVVDGDPMSSQTISLTLEKAGWRTHLAGDPIEAMALASTETFDLVIIATALPGMTGFEACAQLQTLPGCDNAPVLFVSSLENFAAHAEPEVLGGNEIIIRPFLVIELTLKVTTMLETHRFHSHLVSAA